MRREARRNAGRGVGKPEVMEQSGPLVLLPHSPSSVQAGLHTAEGSLFDTDDHRIGADQMLYTGFAESCFLHPTGAVSAGVVEPVGGLDQHIQAHEQSKSVATPIIVDDAFVDNVRAVVR